MAGGGTTHGGDAWEKEKHTMKKCMWVCILMVWDANLAEDEPAARDLNVGDFC